MSDDTTEAQPAPPPDTRFALPRRATPLGTVAFDLKSLLQGNAPPGEILRAADALIARFNDAAGEYDSAFFDPDPDYAPDFTEAEANHFLAILGGIRARVQAGDINGATALLEAESYGRDAAHVQQAYRDAMEGRRAV